MENIVINVERYRGPIRNWWVDLLLGILSIVMGIIVFMHPGQSFFALSIIFGAGILVSGILDLFMASSMHRQSGKGWVIVTGVIEILFGILLLSLPRMSMNVMPLVLAFWLMFRGFALIGVSSDMIAWGIKGPGWVIALAIALILCSFVILFNPIIGVGAIIIWLGVSFLLLGIGFVILAFDLWRLNRTLE